MNDISSDWISSREAQQLDLASSQAPGNSLVIFAANGDLEARCKRVVGIRWPANDDGFIFLPAAFWEDMLPLTGGVYRDWRTGTFSIKKTVQRSKLRSITGTDIIASGVQFRLSAIQDLLGIPTVDRSVAPDLAEAPSSPRKGPGRKKGDGEIDDSDALKAMASMRAALPKMSALQLATAVVAAKPEIEGQSDKAKIDRIRKKFDPASSSAPI